MLKGIPNVGNTCFLNTCLQILLQTPELNFEENEKEEKENENPKKEKQLWIEWKKWRDSTTDAGDITKQFHEFHAFFKTIQHIANQKGFTLFTGYVQNDLSEFLLFFMDTLHDYFKRPKNMKVEGTIENDTDKMAIECYKMLQEKYNNEYSEILDTFYGVYISTIYSTQETIPQKMTSKPESFFLLDLPIPSTKTDIQPSTPSIYSCFNNYISPEYMENGWIDEKTKETKSVYKQMSFWNFPNILVISLQRFHTTYLPNYKIQISKNTELVDFPIENLDLSKYVVGYHPDTYIYDLYGIVNHIGDVNGGHYTAFVLSNAEKKWYHCNDHIIENVIDPQKMITPMAYVLFYRIRTL